MTDRKRERENASATKLYGLEALRERIRAARTEDERCLCKQPQKHRIYLGSWLCAICQKLF